MRTINESWDSNGPYNWDSSFTCKGTWEYTDSREMILRFHSFHVDNNGTILTEAEISKFTFPTEARTQNFFFEASSFIRCIIASWDYADFTRTFIGYLKNKFYEF
jgi:hypothetical protein